MHRFAADRSLLSARFANGRAEVQRQRFPRHPQQVEFGLAHWRRQIRVRAPAKLQDIEVVIDQHARRSIPAQRQAVGLPLKLCRSGSILSRWRAESRLAGLRVSRRTQIRQRCGGFAGINLLFLVNHPKELCMVAHRLRFAQHEETTGTEGVMKRLDHAPLCHRRQVNQHVAATD